MIKWHSVEEKPIARALERSLFEVLVEGYFVAVVPVITSETQKIHYEQYVVKIADEYENLEDMQGNDIGCAWEDVIAWRELDWPEGIKA